MDGQSKDIREMNKTTAIFNGNAHDLNLCYRWNDKEKTNNYWKTIKHELEKYNVVLSAESLWMEYEELDLYKRFSKIKNNYSNIKVVVYLRRQDLLMDSYWNEMIKSGVYNVDINEQILIIRGKINEKYSYFFSGDGAGAVTWHGGI